MLWIMSVKGEKREANTQLHLVCTSSQGISGGGMETTGKIANSKLQKTTSFIEVEPLDFDRAYTTYVLLVALIFTE